MTQKLTANPHIREARTSKCLAFLGMQVTGLFTGYRKEENRCIYTFSYDHLSFNMYVCMDWDVKKRENE